MATKMPIRFETSTEDPWLNAVVITTGDEPRRAVAIRQLLEPADGIS
jgi:2',3'-cyclic-nucleotide 2'-phosphodiesterase